MVCVEVCNLCEDRSVAKSSDDPSLNSPSLFHIFDNSQFVCIPVKRWVCVRPGLWSKNDTKIEGILGGNMFVARRVVF